MSINMDYINSLKEQVENCESCDELQQASEAVLATLNAQLSAITDQIAALEPMLAILDLPTDPMAILGWASNLIDTLVKPMIAPIAEYQLQLVELSTSITDMIATIQAQSVKFPSCSVVTV